MTEPVPQELTDAEKLAALETYIKVLKGQADALRANVTTDLGKRHVEKVGAYLPGGTKMASVSYRPGSKSARITDEAEAIRLTGNLVRNGSNGGRGGSSDRTHLTGPHIPNRRARES